MAHGLRNWLKPHIYQGGSKPSLANKGLRQAIAERRAAQAALAHDMRDKRAAERLLVAQAQSLPTVSQAIRALLASGVPLSPEQAVQLQRLLAGAESSPAPTRGSESAGTRGAGVVGAEARTDEDDETG